MSKCFGQRRVRQRRNDDRGAPKSVMSASLIALIWLRLGGSGRSCHASLRSLVWPTHVSDWLWSAPLSLALVGRSRHIRRHPRTSSGEDDRCWLGDVRSCRAPDMRWHHILCMTTASFLRIRRKALDLGPSDGAHHHRVGSRARRPSCDWYRRGVRPKCAATVRDRLNRDGSSAALHVSAAMGPTPGMPMKRRHLAGSPPVSHAGPVPCKPDPKLQQRMCEISSDSMIGRSQMMPDGGARTPGTAQFRWPAMHFRWSALRLRSARTA